MKSVFRLTILNLVVFFITSCTSNEEVKSPDTLVLAMHDTLVRAINDSDSKIAECNLLYDSLHVNSKQFHSSNARFLSATKNLQDKLAAYEGDNNLVELSSYLWPYIVKESESSASRRSYYLDMCEQFSGDAAIYFLGKSVTTPTVESTTDNTVMLSTLIDKREVIVSWKKELTQWKLHEARYAKEIPATIVSQYDNLIDDIVSNQMLIESIDRACLNLEHPLFDSLNSVNRLTYIIGDEGSNVYHEKSKVLKGSVEMIVEQTLTTFQSTGECSDPSVKVKIYALIIQRLQKMHQDVVVLSNITMKLPKDQK
ncbi:hypothetical protein [Agarivorans albus]|uniref:Uncharacterized protein n=1 Tax=Agarivorans albus MKT 106 TaxID=1331007 RepID=R9PFC9_AGAAL|nr:hypothetical protein [Agarivorans albus]GAD00089.1 hypothetical protein AALB_0169 [Agarivorans albus MKT 106]